ncbi:Arc family DNA-binding protein [Borborobacter arsenicus]|nr:Arc family DNA-binding protein [Pseudaminobacter arsenicus]
MSQSDPPSFHLRLTLPLQKQIKLAAVENERSMNAEILARLERSFSVDAADRAKAVKLLADALSILDKGSGKS